MNGTMLQGFEWELPADGQHWQCVARMAPVWKELGVTAVWLPPACKGAGGAQDVGYGVYDLYDLGEFPQKGTIATKYGTKDEYVAMIRALHQAGIQALADIVLDHRMGADGSEICPVIVEDPEHRGLPNRPEREAELGTLYLFQGRGGAYNPYFWDASCFVATDWDIRRKEHGVFRIRGKQWAQDVDGEKGNYDYLMGADVDVQSPFVREELARWGIWYVQETGVDGFRLDAVKHISAAFYRDWLRALRRATGQELFAVGEYWSGDLSALHHYLDQLKGSVCLFDVPLHYHLCEAASSGGAYDLRNLFEGTLVGTVPEKAVTFVDNHDTQPGQALESWVGGWFKAAGYGLILLRAFGYPCVFWGDLYGIPTHGIGAVTELPLMMRLRRTEAIGEERDYFDHPDVIGFTRAGEASLPGSGLAFVCTNAGGGSKYMAMGRQHARRVMHCVMGGAPDVRLDRDGWGTFPTGEGAAALWVPKLRWWEKLLRWIRHLPAQPV